MKRVALFILLASCFAPFASAQEDNEHLQLGVFADYLRVDQTSSNFGGVGARVSFQAYKRIKMEGQMAYDFDQAITEGFTDIGTGLVSIQRSGLRLLHGEFGPRVNLGRHRVQPFVTLKGGFINTHFSNSPATIGTFFSSVDGLRRSDVSGVLYPGGGLQAHLGPIGLRLDIGDEMYFNHGTHHNLSVAFGPTIQF